MTLGAGETRGAGEQAPFARLFPPVPSGFKEPFWYGSLQSFWLYYRADPEAVAARLPNIPGDGGLEVALFDFEGQPRVSDWNQQRGHLGIAYHFGTEPVATDRIGDYR